LVVPAAASCDGFSISGDSVNRPPGKCGGRPPKGPGHPPLAPSSDVRWCHLPEWDLTGQTLPIFGVCLPVSRECSPSAAFSRLRRPRRGSSCPLAEREPDRELGVEPFAARVARACAPSGSIESRAPSRAVSSPPSRGRTCRRELRNVLGFPSSRMPMSALRREQFKGRADGRGDRNAIDGCWPLWRIGPTIQASPRIGGALCTNVKDRI
jgi:hypothetical protein